MRITYIEGVVTTLTHRGPDGDGIYADTRNAEAFAAMIARVLHDSSVANELRQRGLRRAQHFTWERCARETFVVYQSLMESLK